MNWPVFLYCKPFDIYFCTASLPDNVSFDVATLVEPLARVIHAARRVNLQPSTSVAVLGSGLSSLLTCAFARSLNCYPICIIDTDQTRMNIAVAQGWASHQYTIPSPPPPHTPAQNVFFARRALSHSILRELQIQTGYQTVFEVTGSETGIQLAIFVSRAEMCRLVAVSITQAFLRLCSLQNEQAR